MVSSTPVYFEQIFGQVVPVSPGPGQYGISDSFQPPGNEFPSSMIDGSHRRCATFGTTSERTHSANRSSRRKPPADSRNHEYSPTGVPEGQQWGIVSRGRKESRSGEGGIGTLGASGWGQEGRGGPPPPIDSRPEIRPEKVPERSAEWLGS